MKQQQPLITTEGICSRDTEIICHHRRGRICSDNLARHKVYALLLGARLHALCGKHTNNAPHLTPDDTNGTNSIIVQLKQA